MNNSDSSCNSGSIGNTLLLVVLRILVLLLLLLLPQLRLAIIKILSPSLGLSISQLPVERGRRGKI